MTKILQSATWYTEDFKDFAAPLSDWFHSVITCNDNAELDKMKNTCNELLLRYQSDTCITTAMVAERQRRMDFLETIIKRLWLRDKRLKYEARERGEIPDNLNIQEAHPFITDEMPDGDEYEPARRFLRRLKQINGKYVWDKPQAVLIAVIECLFPDRHNRHVLTAKYFTRSGGKDFKNEYLNTVAERVEEKHREAARKIICGE